MRKEKWTQGWRGTAVLGAIMLGVALAIRPEAWPTLVWLVPAVAVGGHIIGKLESANVINGVLLLVVAGFNVYMRELWWAAFNVSLGLLLLSIPLMRRWRARSRERRQKRGHWSAKENHT